MIRASFVSLAVLASAASIAIAQPRTAPIVRGVTTGDLSQQVDQTRQQTADLLLELNGTADTIRLLKGRIETLEFEVSRLREANEQQVLDREALALENAALRRDLGDLSVSMQAIRMVLGIEEEVPADSGTMPADPGAEELADELAEELAEELAGISPSGAPAARSVTGPASGPPAPGAGPVSLAGPSILARPGSGALPEPGPAGSLGTLSAEQLPGEAGPLFARARQRLLALDYAGAETAFRAFVEAFSDDPQAPEAYFWLGEALHQQRAYAESGSVYATMIRSFPDDVRAPDALARLARSMRLVGETEKACQALDTLPRRYPDLSRVVRDLAAVERTRSGCPD